jgi:hypothetical protein
MPTIEQALFHLSLGEVVVRASHKVLMEVDDNILLIFGDLCPQTSPNPLLKYYFCITLFLPYFIEYCVLFYTL